MLILVQRPRVRYLNIEGPSCGQELPSIELKPKLNAAKIWPSALPLPPAQEAPCLKFETSLSEVAGTSGARLSRPSRQVP